MQLIQFEIKCTSQKPYIVEEIPNNFIASAIAHETIAKEIIDKTKCFKDNQ